MANALLTPWHKGIVEWTEGETAFISVVFSWDAQKAFARAVHYRQIGHDVRVGGPGIFVLSRHPISKQFREVATLGGSLPDVVTRHNPMATFASRGCDVGCWFCIVPPMEGRTFTLLPEFTPRPILCDNNLSALPAYYQSYIVKRYEMTETPLLDANSGFDPATFDDEVYNRWKKINKGPWRFAFDESGERDAVERVTRMLKDVSARRKQVYVLVGNEPKEACLDRIHSVIGWGCEPYVQPVMKLNAQRREHWIQHDWTDQELTDVARWVNSRAWRKCTFDEFDRSRKNG